MSKIGKQPVIIPEGVTVTVLHNKIKVSGEKGENVVALLPGVRVTLEDKQIILEPANNVKQTRSNWGTIRALIANAVEGAKKGFEKILILEGIGYKIAREGESLTMNVGFSHPVRFTAPGGITFEIEKNSILKIRGSDKSLVGQVAAQIRALKKPEPYKGTGFRYSDEIIRRKAGKKAVAAGGTTT